MAATSHHPRDRKLDCIVRESADVESSTGFHFVIDGEDQVVDQVCGGLGDDGGGLVLAGLAGEEEGAGIAETAVALVSVVLLDIVVMNDLLSQFEIVEWWSKVRRVVGIGEIGLRGFGVEDARVFHGFCDRWDSENWSVGYVRNTCDGQSRRQ